MALNNVNRCAELPVILNMRHFYCKLSAELYRKKPHKSFYNKSVSRCKPSDSLHGKVQLNCQKLRILESLLQKAVMELILIAITRLVKGV